MKLDSIYQAALKSNPGKTAYICGETAVTYAELNEKARHYAQGLAALGINPGDRVAFCMHNLPELPQLYFAVFRLGAVAVPISPYSLTPDLAYALNHSASRLLLISRELYDTAHAAAPDTALVEQIITVDDGLWPDRPNLPAEPHFEVNPLDPAVILYTSGSTADPKGIVHTGKSLLSAAMYRSQTLALEMRDIYINTGYLCHGAASTMTLFPTLFSGGTAVFPIKFTPDGFWPLIAAHRPTVAALGPSQLWSVLEHPLCSLTDSSSLRYLTAGGDRVSEQLHRLFQKTMGFPLTESLGMTECGTYITTHAGMEHRLGSMGKPVIGAEVRLVDEGGQAVNPGETGEIVVRTDTMMSGYWADEKNTTAAIIDGWLHTGDTAYQDADGYYYFAGRIKNMLVRDTCNISPEELEGIIRQHPLVHNCGVVGIPDERHGQQVIAFIQPASPGDIPDDTDLAAFASTRITGPRLPDYWFRIEALPTTPLGKIDRQKLQQIALDRRNS